MAEQRELSSDAAVSARTRPERAGVALRAPRRSAARDVARREELTPVAAPAARIPLRLSIVVPTFNESGNVQELLSSVAALKPGVPARFSLLRRDEKLDLNVTPGLRPKPQRRASSAQ